MNGNGFKGYELEAGDYTVSLNRSAHEEEIEVVRSVKDDISAPPTIPRAMKSPRYSSQTDGTWAEYNSTNESLTANMLSRMDLSAVPEAASVADRTMTQAFVDAASDLDNMASCKDEETDPGM